MIRRGKISREDGVRLVKKLEGQYPKSYMGKSICLPILLPDLVNLL